MTEIGDALVGVWRSKAPPSGGNWTDEGCRLTEWIECDLIELSIGSWREYDGELTADGPYGASEPMFVGSWKRTRCPTEWVARDVADVVAWHPYGTRLFLRDVEGVSSPALVIRDYFAANPTYGSPQDIVCERSSVDHLDCSWSSYSELGAGVDPLDRLVLERVGEADEAILCDDLLERYLLSPRSTAPWNER